MTEELIHVRCITCGKVLGNKWEKYKNMLIQGVSQEEAMNKLGLTRYCCRVRMMNPFKIPYNVNRQTDPYLTSNNLTVALPPSEVQGPLNLMVQYTIEPDIPLPESSLPDISLPEIQTIEPTMTLSSTTHKVKSKSSPTKPTTKSLTKPTILTDEQGNVIRVYQAI